MPNLCVVCQYRLLTFEMIRLFLRILRGTHHLKAGSSTIRLATTYSTTSIGMDSFKSLSFIQLVETYFHSTNNSQPQVVIFGDSFPLWLRIIPSDMGIGVLYFLWSVISFMRKYWFPSSSTFAKHVFCNYVRLCTYPLIHLWTQCRIPVYQRMG